ncbi:uracil-DNA glycosylase [Cryptococcus depauperatus CBS 7841]|uniref:Uracil-DNA glycosylase n=1 Tax=Cryptococcus depauperatus CBS 7841 TaxID=1295531 RepID=A0AAJ8JWD1_9TREE
MSPQARSIASYFIKPSAATATANVPVKRDQSSTDADRKHDAENTPTEATERVAKKPKLEDKTDAAPKVAKVTESASSTLQTKMGSTRPSTVEQLRSRLATRPGLTSLLELETSSMGEDWLLALQDEFTKPYFIKLKERVIAEQKTKKVFPPANDVYSWSRFCSLKDVRIVIIGQDPYHDDGQAHGLAFSVRKGIRIPPSLRNIYQEMSSEIPGFIVPKHGDLTEWAKHGVLLLNTSLTVRAHEAGSHASFGWDQFTAAVLRVVTNRLAPTSGDNVGGNGVVFMAWGAHAAKMCAGIDTKKHLILKSAHPSPLSASRGFFGNGHFKKANTWLEQRYGPGGGIDWKTLGAT